MTENVVYQQLKQLEDPNEFRTAIRQLLEEILPEDLKGTMHSAALCTHEGLVRWQRILDDNGLLLINWPEKYGGSKLSKQQHMILGEELVRIKAPVVDIQALCMIGPVLYTFGTDEQKNRMLPKIKRSEIWWCQGFSEPDSGSDLFNLSTTAERQGEHYIVNGQKIWTTRAHWSDMMYAVVRTPSKKDTKPSFSFIMIEMDSPGLTVRPIKSIDNQHHLNEVFFDNVKVPVENLIGEEGQGKEITKFLLTLERLSLEVVEEIRQQLADVKTQIRNKKCSDFQRQSLIRRHTLAEVELRSLEAIMVGFTGSASEQQDPALVSAIKVISSELQQAVTELMVDVLGEGALKQAPEEDGLGPRKHFTTGQWAMTVYLFLRAASIYGGANEVQRNLVFRQIAR